MVTTIETSKFPVIKFDSVTKIYPGGTIGIENLSLEIYKGEIFGFLGQNGAGKTTSIRVLLNILIPQEGTAYINGQAVSRDTPQLRENIGYLPGEWSMPSNTKVEDFLYYIAALKDKESTRMKEIADRFEVPIHRKMGELSKGNKQKVGIVLAFMHDPEIYILDEPTSGLDPLWQQELYNLIREERDRGKTIFFSSHNLDETQKLCDRVAIIREGKLVVVNNVEALAESIHRKLTITIRDMSEEDIQKISSKMDVTSSSIESGEIVITVPNMSKFAAVVDELHRSFSDRFEDISYPPASLEEYFLRKYRE